MPRQPQWFQHVRHALEQIREFPVPVLDRAAVEKLLDVSRRDAIRLLHRFGGYQAGKTFLISREDLIAALERVQAGDDFEHEIRRRERLNESLEATRRELVARRVTLPVSPEVTFPAHGLPSGVRLGDGRIEVEFESAEELLARLFEIAQLASSDFERFQQLLRWNR
jgi:hypothetical protein